MRFSIRGGAAATRDIFPQAGTIHVLLEKEKQSIFFPSETSDPEVSSDRLKNHPKLFKRLQGYQRDGESQATVSSKTQLIDQCIALQGLLCGLLDHWDIGEDELNDVFASPVLCEGGTFNDFHKETLLSFSDEFRLAYAKLGMSPYLLLPQSVLLHNERLLQAAMAKAVFREPNDGATSVYKPEESVKEIDYADAISLMRAVLQKDWIPNLFHYRTEQRLYDDGERGRGLAALKTSLTERLEELSGKLEAAKAKDANFINWTIGFVASTLAIAQVAGSWESIAKAFLRLGGYSVKDVDEKDSIIFWVCAAVGDLAFVTVILLIPVYVVLFRKELGEGAYQLWLKVWGEPKVDNREDR